MKLVILGDTHIGGSYNLGIINSYRQLNSRLIDYSNTFDYVIDYIIENDIKHLAITGDIFENRRPQSSELSIFAEKLQRLSERGVHTHIVIGNHDLIRDQRSTTLDILVQLKLPMVHIYTDINSVSCSDGSDEIINLIFFPFRNRQMLSCYTNEEAIKRLSDRLQYEINGISKGYKILIGHFMIKDTPLGNMVENSTEISLPINMFGGLDGVIMGHVHTHYIIQRSPLITYVGSMERKDFGDSGQLKYFLSIETNNKLIYQFEKLPARMLFDLELDQTKYKSGKSATKHCIKKIEKLNEKQKLKDGIIRINVLINERSAFDFDRDEIRKSLKELKIHNCVGINTQIVSKRQLRKDSITERIDPTKSFEEYLTLIENKEMREMMRERGLKIIGSE